jgi:hypothetical protein
MTYYKQFLQKLTELKGIIPDIYHNSVTEPALVFLEPFRKQLSYWKTANYINLPMAILITIIGMIFLAASIILQLIFPITLLIISLLVAGIVITSLGMLLLTALEGFILYKIGRATGRLESKAKYMLERFPVFKNKILKLTQGKTKKLGITPVQEEITQTTFKSFRNNIYNKKDINLELRQVANIFNYNTDSGVSSSDSSDRDSLKPTRKLDHEYSPFNTPRTIKPKSTINSYVPVISKSFEKANIIPDDISNQLQNESNTSSDTPLNSDSNGDTDLNHLIK